MCFNQVSNCAKSDPDTLVKAGGAKAQKIVATVKIRWDFDQ